jgi:N-acetyltransferase 10
MAVGGGLANGCNDGFRFSGPVTKKDVLPEVLVVIQISLEGQISSQSVEESLSRGQKAAGDLIPWNISEQYGDREFPKLCGARIVRIATHPNYQRVSKRYTRKKNCKNY